MKRRFPALAAVYRFPAGVALALLAGTVMRTAAAPKDAPTTPPIFREVTVHDPSVIKVDSTYYVFGSHLAAARSKDLMAWEQVASDLNPADPTANPLFQNFLEELKETFEWAQTKSLWAADVIRRPNGRFYMYYNACKGDSPRSALGVAVADRVEGPYRDQGILLKSGMWGQPGEDGTIYNAGSHPNTVDPDVFFDHQGKLWMVYGSYSGGIFILKMDEKTGKPLPGQGYGKKLTGGNHSPIEGAYILYHPKSKFYYLYLSFGGLGANGGYNIRVARSRQPDGPYHDPAGNAMIDVKSNPNSLTFDERSIEPYGAKLMGNFTLEYTTSGASPGEAYGYMSPGHNSAYYDPATGRQFLIFHARFPGRAEMHQLRVHQMFLNRDGWPIVAPYRYGGETIGKVGRDEVIGEYAYVNHGKAISAAINRSRLIQFQKDGTVTGAVSGTWKRDGDNRVTLDVEGSRYDGVFVRQWDPVRATRILTFTALSKQGVSVWGSKTTGAPARAQAGAVSP